MTLECARCKAKNPEGNRFCADCGGPLDPALTTIKEMMGATLREQVQEVLDKRYKDQKIIEIETTQAIASRLSDWAKLFGFFVGIPIAILLLFLGALGIKTYSDFSSQVDKAQTEIANHLQDAQARAAKLKKDGEALAADYERLRTQFADTKALSEQLRALSEKVDVIGEKLGFTPSSQISSETKIRLEANFVKFQQYLMGLGYRGTGDTISIDIRDHEQMEKMKRLSYYDTDRRMMVIDSQYRDDPIVLYREYANHVLYSPAGPHEPDSIPGAWYLIQSGLAYYFPCSFLKNPRPATTATTWDLTKKRNFSQLRPNSAHIDTAYSDGTEIWGSAFWELRQSVGQEVADKLLFDTWFKLRPDEVQSDRGASFVRKLLDADPSNQAKIRAVFAQRGLAL